ncbi:MAG: SpoVR family protein [Deltaproteobacteria bacterium]|nr:SpoVR family protein [Deltaproteobacteria bacterium]
MSTSTDLFEIRFRKGLPEQLREMQAQVEQVARDAGLDFYKTVFEMVSPKEMSMLAAYGGFPTRYPHWRFGMEFEQLHKSYSYGLSKIYEMVINTDPCYAYLMDANALMDQKLVMAHVYGHCDFFKNNMWFQHTNRRMIDAMANHATRVRRLIDRLGAERVEEFIDCCLSVENLIDIHAAAIRRQPRSDDAMLESLREAARDGEEPGLPAAEHFKVDVDHSYMDGYINPPEEVLAMREEALQRSMEPRPIPERPERDVLGFILAHAPLHDWEAEVLAIIREEAMYFAPQGQTKIMNEGWATFWHTRLMTEELATAAEIVDYADHHSGTVAMTPYRLNPYKLGLELFRDIEHRWDTGRHGPDYENCDDLEKRKNWFVDEQGGIEKIFGVRRIYNDLQFVDAFLTEEFCREHGFFTYGKDKTSGEFVVESREFSEVKERLLGQLTNFGQPIVDVVDGNFENRGELLLAHTHTGADLQMDWAETTLANLVRLWKRPVCIQTQLGGRPILIRHDGTEPSRVFLDRSEERPAPDAAKEEGAADDGGETSRP